MFTGSRIDRSHKKAQSPQNSFPQVLRKTLWKSWCGVLQSCYKCTLTTLCTRERRSRKALPMNVLSLQQCQRSCVRRQMVHRFSTHLLIVGPDKINTKRLRQTYGERFFDFKEHSNFLANSYVRFRTLQQLRHRNQLQHLLDAITYPLA